MASPVLRIFSYLPNPRVWKALIAARLLGVTVEVTGDKPGALSQWLWDLEPRPLDDDERDPRSPHARRSRRGFGGTLYKTDAFLAGRIDRPYEAVSADSDAVYEAEYEFELSDLVPMVARPGDPGNGVPVESVVGERVKVDQAFLGSCTNSRLEDLEVAARIVKGKRIHPDVRMLVSPASQAVWREASKAGYLDTLAEAGALVEHSTCGPCYGGHLGVLGDRETCISSSNRNFKGRMGSPLAHVWLGSPATVAASALAGEIADPREYL